MNHHPTLIKTVLLLTIGCISFVHAKKLPNIIIFLVDDMGLMDTSVPMLIDNNGEPEIHPLNEFYQTPNMERMGGQGIRFSTFYAQSVCSPSRASLLTGQNATRHKTTTWIRPSSNNRGKFGPRKWNWTGMKAGDVSLQSLLQGAGYKTIHVGKGHLGPDGHDGADPTKVGFDVNVGGSSQGSPGSYLGKDNYRNQGKKYSEYFVPHLEAYHGSDVFLTEALTLEAIKELEKSVEAETPFFLHMSHYAVHTPWVSDPRFAENYADSKMPAAVKSFATLIEGMDKSLGDIMDAVEALGVAEDTLLIFLGDNGSDSRIKDPWSVGSSAPLRGKKGTHYEGGTRIPFIVSWVSPDSNNPLQKKLPIAAGSIQSQMGMIMDVFPTVLNLAGVEVPKDHIVDGQDLATLLSGNPDPSREDNFLMHFPHDHRSSTFTSLHQGDWKLIYHYVLGTGKKKGQGHSERYQLFNLSEDPYETTNLASSNPEKLSSMMKRMVDQLEAEGALYPEKNGEEIRPIMP
ncbi:MAG: sulfatase [Opitutales bacterium]